MLQSYCFCVTQIEANISVSPRQRRDDMSPFVSATSVGRSAMGSTYRIEFFFINVLAAYNH